MSRALVANCARPGCGHDDEDHVGSQCAYTIVDRVPDSGRVCPCPGYRTPKQQSTWREVERVLEQFKRDLPQAPILAIGLLRELQKLYP